MSLAWTDAQGRLMRGLSTFKSEWLAQSLSSDTSTCWLVSCWILSFRNPGNGQYVALVPSSKSSVRPILMTCNKTLSNSKAQNTHLLWLSTVLWVVSAHWCFSQTIMWLSGMAELCKHPQLVWELAGWLLGAGIGCQCEGLHVVFPKHGSWIWRWNVSSIPQKSWHLELRPTLFSADLCVIVCWDWAWGGRMLWQRRVSWLPKPDSQGLTAWSMWVWKTALSGGSGDADAL